MWNKLTNFAKNYFFWMKSGVSPIKSKGTSYQFLDEYTNHFRSKKFVMVAISLIVMIFFYFVSVLILIFLPKDTMFVPFISIFTKIIEGVIWIVTFYISGQAVVDLRYGGSSNINLEGVLNSEQIDQKIIKEETIKYSNIYKNDPSYAPLEWVFNQEETR